MEPNYALVMAIQKLKWSADNNMWSASITPDQCRMILAALDRKEEPWVPSAFPTVVSTSGIQGQMTITVDPYIGDPGDESDHDKR